MASPVADVDTLIVSGPRWRMTSHMAPDRGGQGGGSGRRPAGVPFDESRDPAHVIHLRERDATAGAGPIAEPFASGDLRTKVPP